MYLILFLRCWTLSSLGIMHGITLGAYYGTLSFILTLIRISIISHIFGLSVTFTCSSAGRLLPALLVDCYDILYSVVVFYLLAYNIYCMRGLYRHGLKPKQGLYLVCESVFNII